MTAAYPGEPAALPRPACTPAAIRAVLAANADADTLRRYDAVAELRPLPRRPLQAARLLERWRALPVIDPARLRADIDELLDPSL